MKWKITLAAKRKGKKKTDKKEKDKLRKYWRMLEPSDYVEDMIGDNDCSE